LRLQVAHTVAGSAEFDFDVTSEVASSSRRDRPDSYKPATDAARLKHVIGHARSESKSVMSKRQLIDDIRQYNISVQPQFLAQFDAAALQQYLDHLRDAARKHVRIAGWVRKSQARVRIAS
jgi:hypothetical protein